MVALPRSHKQVERPPQDVTDGVQLSVHSALSSANQASAHPFVGELIPRINS